MKCYILMNIDPRVRNLHEIRLGIKYLILKTKNEIFWQMKEYSMWRINNMVWIFTLNIRIKNVYIICIWTGNFFMVQFTTSFYLASNNSIGTATNKKRCPLNLNFLPVFLRSRNHLRTFYERMIKLFLTRYLYVGWTRFAQWTQPETGTCSIFLQCC